MNNQPHNFHIAVIDWNSPWQAQLKAVREQVFIVEQHVPLYIEWDEHDASATHLLAFNAAQQAVACARILIDHARIGRMGVLQAWRGHGLGRALLDKGIEICRAHHIQTIYISSQTHAIKFYQQAGFVVTSAAYIDANIWHVDMQLTLSASA